MGSTCSVRPLKRRWQSALTVCSAAAVLAGGCGGGPTRSAGAWDRAAAAAFTPLANRIALMEQQRSQFANGSVSGPEYALELGQSESVMASSLSMARRLPPYPGAQLVDPLYVASASLYVEAVKGELAAAGLPAGELRDQAMLIATRLRELADRTFDQGRVLTTQGLEPSGVPAGSDVVLPAEVPDWVPEGLAAGPPLAPAPPPAAKYPPSREGARRPTEEAGRWSSSVRALHVPSPADVAAQLPEASVSGLSLLAQRLQTDSDRIGAMPDPAAKFGREESVRRRLAILIEAEACRLGEVAASAGGNYLPAFNGLARDLLTIAGSFP